MFSLEGVHLLPDCSPVSSILLLAAIFVLLGGVSGYFALRRNWYAFLAIALLVFYSSSYNFLCAELELFYSIKKFGIYPYAIAPTLVLIGLLYFMSYIPKAYVRRPLASFALGAMVLTAEWFFGFTSAVN